MALGQTGALDDGRRRGVHGSVLQRERLDGAAAVVPADQIQLHAGGVDAGEELVVFGELGF